MSGTLRLGLKHALALAVAVGLGVATRVQHTGFFLVDKSLGDVLYGVAAYLSFALVLRGWRVRSVAVVALVVCWCIELFQATGIPAEHADHAFVRWFVGTTFSWHDMACYPVGVAAIAALDRVFLRSPEGEACPPGSSR